MDFENWLKTLADEGGSDLYLTTGAPPSAKFDGELKPLSDERLSPGFTRDLAYELMDGQQAREFDEKLEMNLQFFCLVSGDSESISSNSETK